MRGGEPNLGIASDNLVIESLLEPLLLLLGRHLAHQIGDKDLIMEDNLEEREHQPTWIRCKGKTMMILAMIKVITGF